MLSDLRESGQIEQDADMVIFCYRPEYYGIETYEVGSESFNSEGLFVFLIEKHRNGGVGEIPLSFIKEQAKLKNYEVYDDYKPNYNPLADEMKEHMKHKQIETSKQEISSFQKHQNGDEILF
jgi:replicative DNA helicase